MYNANQFELNKQSKIIRRAAKVVLLLLIIIHAVLGIWWLTAWWLIVLAIYLFLTTDFPPLVAIREMPWVAYPLLLAGVFFLAVGLRVLVYGVFTVPSSSMERTILPGDIIWGNKLSYGPVLPETPYDIPWINFFVWLIEGTDADMERKWWEPKRLRGYRKAAPGDIILFDDPTKDGVMIKRCMGTPGDTIHMVNGSVYINNQLHQATNNLMLFSRVSFNNRQEAMEGMRNLEITNMAFPLYAGHYTNYISLYLTLEEIEKVSGLSAINDITIEKERPDTAWRVYPRHDSFNWSIDDYGPMVLPAKGMKIALTPENWILYNRLINVFENADITENDGLFFTEGNLITEHYTFQKDYYFMLGDNRHDSRDSRYFGPVPGDNIICKATMILFSRNRNEPKHKRILKKLH